MKQGQVLRIVGQPVQRACQVLWFSHGVDCLRQRNLGRLVVEAMLVDSAVHNLAQEKGVRLHVEEERSKECWWSVKGNSGIGS